MTRELYCWRCDMVIPMLDDDEWAILEPLLQASVEEVKQYRQDHGVSLAEARDQALGKAAMEKYFELSGFAETNINALWHHHASLYGPPCTSCGRPLRTPRASFCASCGAQRVERVVPH